ncbi:molybdopterin-guanine dinucleotide biosynthesis protein B [Heyndrickxia ginsengihumi]|uniref:Molybdopterin-guanine dinucleotide biosynthesis protein B n=1 Tax=Heyndrickxia ginsengihumi TaxID=363870 RepID=A0A0A6VAJ3_9BACI|nr:molybdopterin-guanine dinucleotide biosynthesis protein B [Heyndrickxia ginsengihumi]KHD85250.1 hypothetical protein NG54_10430 [Heyndrickxia ginsengihumi]MBE6184556.1 molybdopterin-guanine dinucleotide biosynthesis protein B [Bacillus sp. (in: firmicutes)]MCM3024493.1 molybdopterin-guanine dinucleotide biosynthesis protein B [Heyndrickxia ginsengihumi]NEY21656.1 molybdopterin-guanine dinucleotide biosynthesis protein B [Heyndrickxia ginsengihumi]
MNILQIVGYQDSGKTTLMEKLVNMLSDQGFRVGTLKHHGHGGAPMLPAQKDSTRHFEAGSMMAGVEGEGTLSLAIHNNNGWQIDELVDFYRTLPLDILLIEGFKKASYPKLVCLRNDEEDLQLLELSNVVAAFSFNRIEHPRCFLIQKEESYRKWLLDYMMGESNV